MTNMSFYIGDHPIVSSALNVNFDELLQMSDEAFAVWSGDVRTSLGTHWVQSGIPPHNGTSFDEIEKDMKRLAALDTSDFLQTDVMTGRSDVIVPSGRSGAPLRSLFPNMGKSADGNANNSSVYEYVTADPNSEPGSVICAKWHQSMNRILRKDSMYKFSSSLKPATKEALGATTGSRWVGQPYEAGLTSHWSNYWIEPSEKIADGSELTLTRSSAYILTRLGRLSTSNLSHGSALARHEAANTLLGAKPGEAVFPWKQQGHMRIRPFKRRRVFPDLFSMLRTGLTIQGVNFPSQVAKFLYQRYSAHLQGTGAPITVYDPSMGYGGRCLGALAAACDRPIHYVGTDPNTDNWISPTRSRYHYLADFYNSTVGQRHHASVETYCCGSEDIHHVTEFSRHRGQVDIVFTSPPYFCAELYSREDTQSAIRFPTYAAWRDGFLRPTLKTCTDWLKPGGYLLWNIADVKVGSNYVPLEQDSLTALDEQGMQFIEKLKMPLATVTGGGKIIDGVPTTKNHLKLNGGFRKYEPIFVFRKPS
jgi:hypothetical protein